MESNDLFVRQSKIYKSLLGLKGLNPEIKIAVLYSSYSYSYSSFIVKNTLSFCETSKLDSPASLQVFHIK